MSLIDTIAALSSLGAYTAAIGCIFTLLSLLFDYIARIRWGESSMLIEAIADLSTIVFAVGVALFLGANVLAWLIMVAS